MNKLKEYTINAVAFMTMLLIAGLVALVTGFVLLGVHSVWTMVFNLFM